MKHMVLVLFLFLLFHEYGHAQWAQAINGMGNQVVGALLADGDTLYAGSTFDVYKSTNHGGNWFKINGTAASD